MNPLLSLYQEIILDHNRHPRHFGRLDHFTHEAHGFNPLCGDKVSLTLDADESGNITKVAFEGAGCAISVASASLLTDALHGLSLDEARRLITWVHDLVVEGKEPPELDREEFQRLKALGGVHQFPARVKCATLAWQTLRAALDGKTQEVSTDLRS